MVEIEGVLVGKFFFSGCTDAKLDDKNRFVLPQAMRLGLVEDGELGFSITLGLGGCLTIYRQKDVQKIVERFQSKQHMGKFQKFFTLFFSTLHQTTCDKIGRVVLPSVLKNLVGIQEEILIAGVLNKIEIWPKAAFDAHMKEALQEGGGLETMCEEAFSLLGEEDDGI